ncbi:MAG: PLxRFG domain-containing protein [Gammaproteobacteria bacterium]
MARDLFAERGITPTTASGTPAGRDLFAERGIEPQTPDVIVPSMKRVGGQMVESAGTVLKDVGDNLPRPSPLLSKAGQAVHEYGADVVEANPSQIQTPGDILDKPGTLLKESVAEMAPQIGAFAAGSKIGARVGGAPGALVGGLVPIALQEYGEIRGNQEQSGQDDIPKALLGTAAATALERGFGAERIIGDALGTGLKPLVGGGRLSNILKEAATTAAVEGPLTEFPQTVIERAAGGLDLTTPEAQADYLISSAKGAIGAAPIGAVAGAFAPIEDPNAGGQPAPIAPAAPAPVATSSVAAAPGVVGRTPTTPPVTPVVAAGTGDATGPGEASAQGETPAETAPVVTPDDVEQAGMVADQLLGRPDLAAARRALYTLGQYTQLPTRPLLPPPRGAGVIAVDSQGQAREMTEAEVNPPKPVNMRQERISPLLKKVGRTDKTAAARPEPAAPALPTFTKPAAARRATKLAKDTGRPHQGYPHPSERDRFIVLPKGEEAKAEGQKPLSEDELSSLFDEAAAESVADATKDTEPAAAPAPRAETPKLPQTPIVSKAGAHERALVDAYGKPTPRQPEPPKPLLALPAPKKESSAEPPEKPASKRADLPPPSIGGREERALLEAYGKPIGIDRAAHEAATSPKNDLPEPTAAQKEAGNYKKAHVRIAGMDVSIENPAGSHRRPEWPEMKAHYGYVRGTVGHDKDHLDVFVKPGTVEDYVGPVFVVNQAKEDGIGFDEHKVMIGYPDEAAARAAYLENYTPGWKGLKSVVPMDMDQFKAWAYDQSQKGPRGGELAGGASSTQEPPATEPPLKQSPAARKIAAREAQRDVFAALSTVDSLADLAAENLTGFADKAKPIIAAYLQAQIAEATAANDAARAAALQDLMGEDGQPNLPAEFYRSLHAQAKRRSKEVARDPAVYNAALARAMVEDGIESHFSDDMKAAYKAGFDHAIAGKTKSTLGGDIKGSNYAGVVHAGYEAAQKWMQTPEGRTYYQGKRGKKLENTGAELRRWFDNRRQSLDQIATAEGDLGDWRKVWETVLARSARADVLRPDLEGATPGTVRLFNKIREVFLSFPDWFTNFGQSFWYAGGEMPAGSIYSRSLGSVENRVKGYFEGRGIVDESERAGAVTRRLRGLAYQAQLYISDMQRVSEHLSGAKSVEELAQKWESLIFANGIDVDDPQNSDLTEFGTRIQDRFVRREYSATPAIEDAAELTPSYKTDWKYGYARDRKNWVTTLAEGQNIPLQEVTRATPLIPPRLDRVTRTGLPDYRRGRDVTPQEFKDTFGFADVGFGKWVSTKQDQDHLNYAYDAFRDLADLLRIDPKSIGFGGKLHFTIGALGHGKFAAHFQSAQPHPDGGTVPVINLTNTRGDGTVAHEWIHALDHFMKSDRASYLRSIATVVDNLKKVRDADATIAEVEAKFLRGSWYYKHQRKQSPPAQAEYALTYGSYASPRTTAFKTNADALGEDYWGSDAELLARAAEAWAFDELSARGQGDDYLVSSWVKEGTVKNPPYRGTPYPEGTDRARFAEYFRALVSGLKFTEAGPVFEGDTVVRLVEREKSEFNEKIRAYKERLDERYEEILAERRAKSDAQHAQGEADRQAQEERERQERQARLEAELAAAALPKVEPMGPLSEGELSNIFDEAMAESTEATQEKPDAPPPGAPVLGVSTGPKGKSRPQSKQEIVSKLAADAAKLGVKGIDEALKGLVELFGGGRLQSFPDGFDEEAYARAKPHFEAALKAFQDAGKTIKDLFRWLFEKWGAGIKPYAIRFAQDQALGFQLAPAMPKEETDVGGGNAGHLPGKDVSAGDQGGTAEAGPGRGGDREPVDVGLAQAGAEDAAGGDVPGTAQGPTGAGDARPGAGESVEPPAGVGGGADVRPESGGPRVDFTITDETGVGEGGIVQKYKDNVAAIRIIKTLRAEQRDATPGERAKLAKYVGWGGLKQAFDPHNPKWSKPYAELRELLTDEEYRAARASILNAHYTSPEVVTAMFDALAHLGFEGGRVLEPSVGVGNFFGLMPRQVRAASRLFGVELDAITSDIVAQLYPNAKIAKATGFQDYKIPAGYFDLTVGNPPFGSEPLSDDENSPYSKFSIHNYFIAKAIDKTRPGGLLAFVISHNFLDRMNPAARQFIAERADLVGAARLPNTAFKGNANTEVVTDIVIFQRVADRTAPDAKWMHVAPATLVNAKNGESVKAQVNQYFIDNPKHILGQQTAGGTMYRANEYTVEPTGELHDQLTSWMTTLPSGIYQPIERSADELDSADSTIPDGVKVGSYYLKGEEIRERLPDTLGLKRSLAWQAPNDAATARMRGMIRLRDLLRDQMRMERLGKASDAEMEVHRKKLKSAYDAFVKEYGFLNSQVNRRTFFNDTEAQLLFALEREYDRGLSKSSKAVREEGAEPREPSAKKADILSRRVLFPPPEVLNVTTAKDALIASLNLRGRVDVDYMQQVYGKDEDAVVSELGDAVFYDPHDGDLTIADEYLSGDVKTKLAQAVDGAKADKKYQRNIAALEKVIPADLLPSQIHAPLGAHWVPPAHFSAFASEITGYDGRRTTMTYVKATASWLINWSGEAKTALNSVEYGTSRMSAAKILESMMIGRPVEVKKKIIEDGKEKYITDKEETDKAAEKQAKIRAKWDAWVWADPARATELAAIYNEKLNRRVERKFTGDHLTLPGVSPVITLRKSQKDAVWRSLQERQVLFDHVVGAGKTFTGIAVAMEWRRLGISRKPMIVVPNHLTLQWRDDFARLYPASTVLAATPEDFSKESRKRLFSKIATGDWDAVVVGHSSLKKIGLPAETERRVLSEQLNEISEAIETMKRERGDKNVIRDMEKIKATLAAKLAAKLQKVGTRDDVVSFDELGVDSVMVDEAHEFKNLFFFTQKQRVAGLGNPAGSAKAFDLFVKTQWLFDTFGQKAPLITMTGTPVSNSLVEMYNMQRYMQYAALREIGVHQFDAWAKLFGDDTPVYEVTPSGVGYRVSTRFGNIKNAPALMGLYSAFADVITLDDLKRNEAAIGKRFPVPRIQGGKPTNIVAAKSGLQKAYIGEPLVVKNEQGEPVFEALLDDKHMPEIGEREGKATILYYNGHGVKTSLQAETEDAAKMEFVTRALSPMTGFDPSSLLGQFANLRELMKKTKGKINALSLTNLANKVALDFRIVDPAAPDFPGSKVNTAVDNIVRIWKNWQADRGTQLVFCDLSVPASARLRMAAKELRVYVRDDAGALVHKRGTLHTVPGVEGFPFYLVKGAKTDKPVLAYDAMTGTFLSGSDDRREARERIEKLLQSEEGRLRWLALRNRNEPVTQDEIEGYKIENDIDADEEGAGEVSIEDLEASAGSSKFSVYDDMKAKLVAKGVPEKQIAFIHDFNSPKAKAELFKRVNRGEVRILFGSTGKMGAGTNVQERAVALHHIDAPWRPSDLEQREGRVIRQGNKLYERDPEGFAVEILRYATNQTYDTRRWQVLEHKANTIEQIRKYSGQIEFEDIAPEAANAAEMKAAASGSPLILRDTELRGEIKQLEAARRAHEDEQYVIARRSGEIREHLDDRYPKRRKKLEQMRAAAEANPEAEKAFAGVTIDGVEHKDRDEAVKALGNLFKRADQEDRFEATIKYRGIPFSYQVRARYYDGRKREWFSEMESPLGSIGMWWNQEPPSPSGVVTRMRNEIERIPEEISRLDYLTAKETEEIEELQAKAGRPFDGADGLANARAEHMIVQRKLMRENVGAALKPEDRNVVQREIARRRRDLLKAGYAAQLAEMEVDDAVAETPAAIEPVEPEVADLGRWEDEGGRALFARGKRPPGGLDSTHGRQDLEGRRPAAGERAAGRQLDGESGRGNVQYSTLSGNPPRADWAEQTRARVGGRPQRIFRGSNRPLSVADFEPGSFGKNTGSPTSGLGVWFTTSETDAGRYGIHKSRVHLDIRNPFIIEYTKLPEFGDVESATKFREKIRRAGYDAIVLRERDVTDVLNIVLFDPERVIPIPPEELQWARDATEKARPRAGLSISEAREYLAAKVGPRALERLEHTGAVRLITGTEAPAEARKYLARGEAVYGYYSGGTSYLIVDQLTRDGGPTDAYGILLHEVGVHHGLRSMLGDELFASVIRETRAALERGAKDEFAQAVARARILVPEGTPAADIPEETVAWLVTERANHELPLVKRTLAKIRAFLIRLGFTKALNADALVELARGAAARAGSRAGRDGPMFVDTPTENMPTGRVDDAKFARGDLANRARTEIGHLLDSQRGFNRWWHRTIGTQFHKAQIDQDFKRVFDKGQDYLTDVSRYAMDAESEAPDLLLRMESVKDAFRLGASQKDIEAVAPALFEGTLAGGANPDKGRIWSDDELRNRFHLNDQQIRYYKQARAAVDESLDTLAKSTIHKVLRPYDVTVDMALGLEDAAAVARDAIRRQIDDVMLRAHDERDRASLTRREEAERRAADIEREADELRKVLPEIDEIEAKAQTLKAAGYFPLQRFGEYAVYVTQEDPLGGEPEEVFFGLYESQRAANQAAAALRAEYPGADVRQSIMGQEQFKLFRGLNPETLGLFADYLGVDDDPALQAYLRVVTSSRSAMRRLIHRKGMAGYSQDVVRVLASFVTSNARMASSNVHLGEMQRAVNDIYAKKRGDVADEASRLYEYLINPTEEAGALRGYLFLHFLGGSVASALVNATQPVLMTFPYLSQFTSAGNAGRQLARAAREAASGADPLDIRHAMTRAREEGIVAPHEIHQLMATARGAKGQSLWWHRFTKVWGSFFALAEAFNRRATFIAAYRIAQANNHVDPYGFARQAVYDTQGVYNKGNRPNWARGPVGATVFTFKQFSIAYLEFLKRLPRKQQLIALALLTMAAGLQGAPGADDLDDLIDTLGQWLGFATNAKRWKREMLSRVLGETAAEWVLHGVSAGLPLDLSMRLGMGNLIPGTALLKPSADASQQAREIGQVIGPVGGLVTSAGQALERAAKGDAAAAVQAVMPKAVKDLFLAYEMATTGEYRDPRGRLVTEVTGADALVRAFGFNPTRAARQGRAMGEIFNDVELHRATEYAIAEKWGRGIVERDIRVIDAARRELREWNAKNPELKIVITPQQIQRRVRDARATKEQRVVRGTPPELRQRTLETLPQ